VLWNRVLRRLSSLPLAIGELALIALLSAVGTIIEQNKPLEFYMQVPSRALLLTLPASLPQPACMQTHAWVHSKRACKCCYLLAQFD
jgi:hypothetical protein